MAVGNEKFDLLGTRDAEAAGTWSTGFSDYAEYFESETGKTTPIGTTKKTNSDKIVACSGCDSPIGVVRLIKASSVIGGSAWDH